MTFASKPVSFSVKCAHKQGLGRYRPVIFATLEVEISRMKIQGLPRLQCGFKATLTNSVNLKGRVEVRLLSV